jgi:hypothetical protein
MDGEIPRTGPHNRHLTVCRGDLRKAEWGTLEGDMGGFGMVEK